MSIIRVDVFKAEYHMSEVAVKQLKSIEASHIQDFVKETLLMLYDFFTFHAHFFM